MMKVATARLIGLVLAAVVSTAALVLAAGTPRAATDPALSPFAFDRVIVVHALASLLLSWALASRLLPERRSLGLGALFVAVGAGLAWLTVTLGTLAGAELDSARAGYTARLLVRVVWCLVLQIPWCALGEVLAGSTPRRRKTPALVHLFALALVVALAIPVGYLNSLIKEQTALARGHWGNRRMEKARQVVVRLCDLGSNEGLGESGAEDGGKLPISPRLARLQLEKNIEYLRDRVARLKSGKLSDEKRLLLAQDLASLGQLEAARTVIEPLASRDLAAAVILAQLHQEDKAWRAGSRWYRKVLKLAEAARPNDPAAAERLIEVRQHAYDALAHNARELQQFEAAEGYYHEALERLPARRAYFHLQLGRHYKAGGSPVKAVEHLSKAAELAPDEYPKPDGVLVSVLSNGTPVGIFAPAASNRNQAKRAGPGAGNRAPTPDLDESDRALDQAPGGTQYPLK